MKEKKTFVPTNRSVPGFNAQTLANAQEILRVPDTHTADVLNARVVDIFSEHNAQVAQGAVGTGRIPSKIQQMLVNRIEARLMTRLWAIEMGDVNPVNWGELLAYRTHNQTMPKIYSIGAPGGNWHEILVNPDTLTTIGDPTFYTTPELLVSRFDPRFVGRYRQDLAEAADLAAMAIENQIDTDCMSAVNAQIVLAASGDLISAGMTFVHPKAYGVPTYNALDLTTEGAVTMEVYRQMVLHAMKLNRRIESVYMHPDTIGTMWQQMYTGSTFPTWPNDRRDRMMDEGERAYNSFFGQEVPTPTPTLAINPSATEKYFYALLSPNDDMVPRGVFWLFTYPEPYTIGDGQGQAYFYDRLEYIGHRTEPGRLYDVFLLQKAVNIAYTNYQRPNLLRVRYA